MRPLAVVVTGDPVPPTARTRGDFPRLIREAVGEAWSGPWLVVDCRQTQSLPEPDEVAGWIVTGSPSSVTERAEWMLRAEQAMRSLVALDAYLLGVCFGHQLLASALGGLVERNPNGREMGSYELGALANDELFEGLPLPPWVNMSHADSVVEPPRGARVLARTAREPHAAMRLGPRTWTVQFHPEFDAEVMQQYVNERSDLLAAEGQDPARLLAGARDTDFGRGTLRRFVEIVARERR